MFRNVAAVGSRHPAIVWGIVMAAIFIVEYFVMIALPVLLAEPHSRILEALIDAVTLTAVIAPLIWWTIVKPARQLEQVRTQFMAELLTRLEAERRRYALELHDGVGQTLSVLVAGLRSEHDRAPDNERIERLQTVAQDSLRDIKRLARGMRPSLLDDLGIGPALERLVADMRESHSVEITLDITELNDIRLPDAIETATFRIIQEALANIVTHAHAKHARVVVGCTPRAVQIQVSDDGRGLDESQQINSNHLGLRGMKERAQLLGGSFKINARLGGGTQIDVAIPLT